MRTLLKISSKKLVFTFVLSVAFAFLLNQNVSAQGYNIEVSPAKSNLSIEPGQTYTQTFRIGNYSGSKRTLYMYVQDFTVINEEGTPTFFESDINDEESRRFALSQWVSLPAESIEIEDNETAEVDLLIDVPADAEAGGHYGAFFVQTEKPQETEGSDIGTISRIASIMLVNVPGDITEEVIITSAGTDKMIYFEDDPQIQFITYLKNEGNVHGIPVGAFSISGGFGSKTKSVIYNQSQGAILPGAPERKITETFNLKQKENSLIPPIGKFSIDLIARYGPSNLPLETTVYFWLLPAKFIAIAVLSIVVGAFVLYRALMSFKK